MGSLGVFSVLSLALHCVSAARGLKLSGYHSFCALGAMPPKRHGEVRQGGGYKQREKKRKLAERGQLQQSGLAKHLVLKPPPLYTPPPYTPKFCLY